MADLVYFVCLCVVQTQPYTDSSNKELFCVEMQAYSWTNRVLGVTKRHLKSVGGFLLVSKEFFKVGKSHLNDRQRKGFEKKSINWMIGTAGTVH